MTIGNEEHTFWLRGVPSETVWERPLEANDVTIGAAFRTWDNLKNLNPEGLKEWLWRYFNAVNKLEDELRETDYRLRGYERKYGEAPMDEIHQWFEPQE